MSSILHPLDFEKNLVEEEEKLESLKQRIANGELDLRDDYDKQESVVEKTISDLYGSLTPYQRVQLSRHFDRPFCMDYIDLIFTDFRELHGDRLFRDDPAIIGGVARLADTPVMVVGHQRGRSTAERVRRNFGMAQPEGYRKALRLFRLAEKFNLPLITMIDTQGAYPGIEAEERGQAEAIAKNLYVLATLKTPVISVVIGEGGSGGALALGVSDKILMMENACYSVITPEGCASILWKDAEKAPLAAESLQLTAPHLKKQNIIDEIVTEPVGGAHRGYEEAADNLKFALQSNLKELRKEEMETLIDNRYKKYRAIGVFLGE